MFVFDEAPMISVATWGPTAQLKYVGNIVVVLGDFEGQFGPVGDELCDELPDSVFMRDLVNKFSAKLNKYRRGDDYGHFKFTTRIYPQGACRTLQKSAECPGSGSYTLHCHGRVVRGNKPRHYLSHS